MNASRYPRTPAAAGAVQYHAPSPSGRYWYAANAPRYDATTTPHIACLPVGSTTRISSHTHATSTPTPSTVNFWPTVASVTSVGTANRGTPLAAALASCSSSHHPPPIAPASRASSTAKARKVPRPDAYCRTGVIGPHRTATAARPTAAHSTAASTPTRPATIVPTTSAVATATTATTTDTTGAPPVSRLPLNPGSAGRPAAAAMPWQVSRHRTHPMLNRTHSPTEKAFAVSRAAPSVASPKRPLIKSFNITLSPNLTDSKRPGGW